MTVKTDFGRREAFMSRLFAQYESGEDFWDLVVLSAGDPDQKKWYEAQLGSDPNGNQGKIVVFADPGGVRVGDGGATLNIIHQLEEEFGDSLYEKRILLMHAGGFSKRLPSHSCTSKIFSPLPIRVDSERGKPFTMLELKMVQYLPFLRLMGPGMFICASDDIITYNIDDEAFEDMRAAIAGHSEEEPRLYSLAHPSVLAVGTGHGVFKLSGSDRESLSDGRARIVNDCLEVLQKPSVELMREREMIFQSYLYGRSGDHEEEFVFTDSAYWINTALMNKFRQFYLEVMPDISTVETSIYSDFMTCQGSDAVAKEQRLLPEKRDPLRRKIAELMCDVPLHILALPDSTFYHIGTMQEYLDVFCTDPDIRDEILSRA